LKNLIVVVPPLSTQRDISKYLDCRCSEIDEIMNVKKKQLSIVKKQQAAFIFEYITGKKCVKEVR